MMLQQVLRVYTVGGLLAAWRNPKNHRHIEGVFDSPQQARQAVAVCAAWLGHTTGTLQQSTGGWWHQDTSRQVGQGH